MSDSLESQRRKINSAEDLQAVVRTMKAMAASSIGQYENAVHSLDDYYRTVQLGLSACFRQQNAAMNGRQVQDEEAGPVAAIVFGSDQGLVGQFNEVIVDFVATTLADLPGRKTVWAVGERVRSGLENSNYKPDTWFTLPNTIAAITPLVGQILMALEVQREKGAVAQVYLFHHRSRSRSAYGPVSHRLLPLDEKWRRDLSAIDWPSANLPEVLNNGQQSLLALVREYIFVSLFRACAESLASENASRLLAMQRAEKNIDELLETAKQMFHRLRQGAIDEELFDVVSGFEALAKI